MNFLVSLAALVLLLTPLHAWTESSPKAQRSAPLALSTTSATTETATSTPLDAYRRYDLERSLATARVHEHTHREPRIWNWNWNDIDDHEELAADMQSNGGFILLAVDDEEQRATIQAMWSTMTRFFDALEASDEPNSKGLQHQTLLRVGSDETKDSSGYNFVQTYLQDGRIEPSRTILDALDDDPVHVENIQNAYLLFSDMAMRVGIAAAAGATNRSPEVCEGVLDGLLHDRQRFSGAYHRLSRYLQDPSAPKDRKESLCSHTDWTVTTPIPISDVPGLELWMPAARRWLRPEEAFADKQIVVVMAGKWLELLTDRKVESCIHRVMTDSGCSHRLSAPFFLRPRELIFNVINDRYGSQPEQIDSADLAIARIHEFFSGYMDQIESSLASRSDQQ